MPRIFISYRRTDSAGAAGRIYDRLAVRLGKRSVFKDVDKIPLGTDFRAIIESELITCDVMLVLIGREWTDAKDDAGNRRLDNSADFVRIELELGLRHHNVRVIPVLVDGATMPSKNDLPPELWGLTYHNAAVLRNDPDFDRDIDRLIHVVAPPNRLLSMGILAALVVLIAALALIVLPALTPTVATPNPTRTENALAVVDSGTPTSSQAIEPSLTPSDLPSATFTDSPTDTPAFNESLTRTFSPLTTFTLYVHRNRESIALCPTQTVDISQFTLTFGQNEAVVVLNELQGSHIIASEQCVCLRPMSSTRDFPSSFSACVIQAQIDSPAEIWEEKPIRINVCPSAQAPAQPFRTGTYTEQLLCQSS